MVLCPSTEQQQLLGRRDAQRTTLLLWSQPPAISRTLSEDMDTNKQQHTRRCYL